MDRNLIKLLKCFICDIETTFYCKNIHTLVSKHTDTPIIKFIEKFIGHNLEDATNTQIICQECLIKIDEYDLAFSTAERVEKELTELLNKKRVNYIDLDYIENITKSQSSECNEEPKNKSKQEVDQKCKILQNKDPIIMKCNVCRETFKSLSEMKSHSHSSMKRRGRPRKNITDNSIIILDEKLAKNELVTVFINNNINETQISDDDDDDDDMNKTFFNNNNENVKNNIEYEEEYLCVNEIDPILPNNKQNNNNNLTKNYAKQHIKANSPHKCTKCNKVFRAKTEYRIHIKSHEDAEKLVCHVCGMIYKSKSALDIHVGLHQGLSPHECPICCKKFTQKGALVRHMPIHTGERPYQCDKCGKQFLHYSSFHMHQLVHDNIREKKCSICGLELRSNSHLTRHLMVHSGEKPYACPTCGQKFAQRYNMTTHYRTHQGIHRVYSKHFTCPICNNTFQRKLKLDEHLANVHKTITNTEQTTFEINVKEESN